MFTVIEKTVLAMSLLRIVSGGIEIFAALLMIKFNAVEKALLINSSLALIGPLILLSTTTIGLIGIVEKVSLVKMVWVFAGVACILYGVKQ
ncbi:YqhV family protein [Neobacillus sp. YIM B06451]|uniref:YqhV family protein n=1 Tax=Neobacillus sp. YIM B06451 TaxID=3070994 RepID=UPI00292F961B|nr:YqhV family protein [Neobacillus sp. YIM B06451]